MIIKRFQAKTEQEAVDNAKKELGPGVVIMNVKNVKKKGLFAMFKKNMVEVTVALEEETTRPAVPVKSTPVNTVKKESSDEVQADKPPVPLTALEQLARVQEREIREQKERENAMSTLAVASSNATVTSTIFFLNMANKPFFLTFLTFIITTPGPNSFFAFSTASCSVFA